MSTGGPVPKVKRAVSADELLAGSLREQARAVMRWAIMLRDAELTGDWSKVAAAREDIAACSQGLACFASDLEALAKAPRR